MDNSKDNTMPSEDEVISELDLGEPPESLLQWAKEHIHEDPETRDQVVSDFRDMIYARGECTPHRMDDAYLLRYLRCRNFSIEAAHKLIVRYYEFKENNPEFFQNVTLGQLKKIGDDNLITVPPHKDQSGRRLLLYRWNQWDPERISVEELFQATMVILELAILEQSAQILGGICIFDLGGLSMQQAWYMTPSIAHKMVQIMVTSFPMKVHAMHIVNQSWVFDIVYNIFKPFLDDRMRSRVFFHGDDFESLHQHVDPKYLPERYGGIQQDSNYNDWIESFRKNKNIVKELKSLGYNDEEEEKRLTFKVEDLEFK